MSVTTIATMFFGKSTISAPPSEEVGYAMDLGRTKGFYTWNVPTKAWVKRGASGDMLNCGLTYGFWFWSRLQNKWVKGGGVVG